MTDDLEMRRGDLKPDLIVDLTDNDEPMDLSAATAVSIIAVRNGTQLFKREATSYSTGMATLEWEVGDTASPGTLTVEVEVIWPGPKPQTIRPNGVVKVLPDLG